MSSDDCDNKITVSHDDPRVINRIIKAYERDRLFEEFMPCPKELCAIGGKFPDESIAKMLEDKYGAFNQTEWCIKNWGRHSAHQAEDISLSVISPNKIGLWMMSRWFTPLPFLNHWVNLGCTVSCIFFEPNYWILGFYKDKAFCTLSDNFEETPNDIEPFVEWLFASLGDAQAKASS